MFKRPLNSSTDSKPTDRQPSNSLCSRYAGKFSWHLMIAFCACLVVSDAMGVVRKVNPEEIPWNRFHEGYSVPSPNQEIWQYSFSFEAMGKPVELKTHIYFVVDLALDNPARPNYMQGSTGAADYIKRQNKVYDELMETTAGYKMLSPLFVNHAIDQEFPLSRKHYAVTNFEWSSFKTSLRYWAENHPQPNVRQNNQLFVNDLEANTRSNAIAHTSSAQGYRQSLQIGGFDTKFGSGASASIVVRGVYDTEIRDITRGAFRN